MAPMAPTSLDELAGSGEGSGTTLPVRY